MSMIKASEALMQIFRIEGVEYVFGLPGSTEIEFMAALDDHPGIRYVLGLHECVVSSIASGYARASGKVGVLNLHTSVGLAAAMPTLLNARGMGVPLVVTVGQPDSRTLIREGGLSGDVVGMGKQFAKWSTEVSYAENLVLTMRRAFKVAMQPPTGLVCVSLPQNILAESLDFKYVPNPPLAFSRRRPDQEIIERAAELLVKAQAPIIIVGNGITKDKAESEVVELAELIGAYVYRGGMMGDVNFPTTHPQCLADLPAGVQNIGQFLQSMDILVVIGGPVPAEASKVIQIGNDPWEIGKNFPVTVGIEGDIKLSVVELNRVLREKLPAEARQAAEARAKKLAKEKEAWMEASIESAQEERDNIPISASRLMQEIAEVCQPGTVIAGEPWSHGTSLSRYIDFAEPRSYLGGGGPSIGQGLPIALGVKLAMPDRPVMAIVGDGATMWAVQSFWTAAYYNIPVTCVILANGGYRLIKSSKIRLLGEQARGKFVGMEFVTPEIDFCQIARGMGVQGQRVEQPDELKEALKAALESRKPALVEVVIDGTV